MRQIILVMVILLMGVFAVEAQASNARVIEMWEALNMREAPSDDAAVVVELTGRTPLFVSGRTRDNRWYAAQTEAGVSGWVASGYIELLSISQDQLPILDASASQPQPESQNVQEPQVETVTEVLPEAAAINARVAAGLLNLRAAPDTNAAVLSILPQGTGVQAIGRSADTAWIQVQMGDGTVGWLAAAYLTTTIDFASLPVVGADPVPQQDTGVDVAPAQTTTSNLDAYFVLGANARSTFALGQQLGNRANVFSKVGDSITVEEVMFRPFGYDRYTLGGYGYLQSTIDFYRFSSARTDNSFNNESLAARAGWTTASVLDVNFANSAVCEPNETPLACEYRLNRPAVALIMFGSNDMIWLTTDQYAYNLRVIVQMSLDAGVIPVLSTIPLRRDYEERSAAYNEIILRVASETGTSLWDYRSAMNTLPNNGLSQDGLHPSMPPEGFAESANFTGEYLQYGYVLRNLMALHVLHTIRAQVIGQ